jgi:peptidoglycan hydrolase-like amidase
MRKIVFIFGLVLFIFFILKGVRGIDSSCNNPNNLNSNDDIERCKNEIQKDLDLISKANTTNENTLNNLNKKINLLKERIVFLEKEILKKEEEIKQGETALEYQKKLLFERVKNYYKNINKSSFSIINILLSENLEISLRSFFYQKSMVDEDKKTIIKIVSYIKNLEDKKANLDNEKNYLAQTKSEVDKQSRFLAGEITKARKYISELSTKIAQLSARQQQLIAQRQASLGVPRSAGTSLRGCSDDRGVDPGFSPAFAFFTYGAPHRNGLNQYGARGRAKAGQNEEEILKEYYPHFTLKKDYDVNAQVNVEGYGVFSIEDYVKRIYEMPTEGDWAANNLAALKAQAVAARTYALNSMQRKGSICTTEACQVFKPEPKGGNWERAVEATRGWVLMDGDKPAFTEYASTHGGYILNLNKFDGSGGSPGSFIELNERAYDKDSPWFYCDWGYRAENKNTAWLRPGEVADIINVIMLAKIDNSLGEHLYQIDRPNPAGIDTWSHDRVKEELKKKGVNPFSTIFEVSVEWDKGVGKTTKINFSGDAGSQSFDGLEFKNWFNVRAPANIQIIGPLYNIEKK